MTSAALPVAGHDVATWPLAGVVVRARGDSTALRVAAARLRGLGCTVEPDHSPAPAGAPAGWLGVIRVPFGAATAEAAAPSGATAGAAGAAVVPFRSVGRVLPECAIGWAGPVGVPMAGELDVQAACGIMHVHGRAAGGPRALRLDYASVCAGVLAAQAITAGLLALLRGGPALSATTSVAQAALLALTQYVAVATAADPPTPSPYAATALGPTTSSEARSGDRTPPFRSADGVRFEIETFDAERWRDFWTALGAEPRAVAAGWPPFQQRFATAVCALPPALGAAAGAVDYGRAVATALAAGVSVLPVRAAAAPLVPPPASPWRLRGLTDVTREPSALPPLGPYARGPLSGLLVVESTNRVQGPLAGHVLGLLGADVVRLEPPGGDPLRGVPPMAGRTSARFLALNRGKRALEADLKSGAGRRAALRLVACAHAFLHNWPPGRAAAFGLDHDDLALVRPSLVYAEAGGWAETLPPPQPMGTDYLVQAYSGVAALLAAPGEPPAPSLMTLTDVLGALISAEGVTAALVARARTGTGVRASTALVDAARLLRSTAASSSTASTASTASGASGVEGTPGARVVTDLADMAADPAYAGALDVTPHAVHSRAPWIFAPVAHPKEAT